MTDAPEWELLHRSHWDTTERLEIPGGWLVRSVWRKHLDVGQPHLDGSAVVFVPMADDTELQRRRVAAALEIDQRLKEWRASPDGRAFHATVEETSDAPQETEVHEAESGEAGNEPEQVGLSGQDHGPRRGRPRK